MFRICNGHIYFLIKENKITIGHNITLVTEQSILNVRKYSFSRKKTVVS